MRIYTKKGLSPIIATVLLILLTVSAATFISVYLFGWFPKQFEKTKCNNYIDYFYFNNELGYNCYESFGSTNFYKISIAAKNVKPEIEEEVEGFNLAFYKEGDSNSIKVMNGQDPGEIRMLSNSSILISIPKSGETRSFNYTTESNFKSLKVSPILKSQECEGVESISILSC